MYTEQNIKDDIRQIAFTMGLDVSAFIDNLDFASSMDLLCAIKLMQTKHKLKLRRQNENKSKNQRP